MKQKKAAATRSDYQRKAPGKNNAAPKSKKAAQRRGAQPKKAEGGLAVALVKAGSALGKFGLVALIGAAVYGASHAVANLELMPVERVLFAGEFNKVQQQNLVRRVNPYLESGYLGLDLPAMRKDLEGEPWVYSVRVSRKWPRKLEISVVEEKPIARWNENGLMNHKGELFSPANKVLGNEYRSLPLLSGAVGSESLVVQQYWQMSQRIAEYGLSISKLSYTAQREWRLELADGQLLVLPEAELEARLSRFFKIYKRNLVANFSNVVSVDMRYQQGMAIKWREESEG